MAQIYLLSVVTLLFGGALAASDFLAERISVLAPLSDFAANRRLVLIVGVITLLVGVLKLFVRAPGDGVPVAGDLLPALAGIAAGAVLVLARPGEESASEGGFVRSVIEYRNPIGLASILVGLLHFLLPGAVIL